MAPERICLWGVAGGHSRGTFPSHPGAAPMLGFARHASAAHPGYGHEDRAARTRSMKKYAWAVGTLLCCAVGFYLRWLNAHADLASPWVDENDVVQQAVAFMGGEWRYYLLEYG